MESPKIPVDETLRLQSLQCLRILDTAPEYRFDRITHIARRLFGVPIALISLVDSDRQWFKSKQGLDVPETSRKISFCGHAIVDEGVFVVEDATKRSTFSDNPLVIGAPGIRFYAGCPIHAPDGRRIGTLCLIDSKPRRFSKQDIDDLAKLGSIVDEELLTYARDTMDELTRITNRMGFFNIANHILPTAVRNDMAITLTLFNINSFRHINETYGNQMGDHLLLLFAELLLKSFGRADLVARLGADEFCVLTIGEFDVQDSLRKFEKLFAASPLTAQYPFLSWRVGVSETTRDTDTDVLLRQASENLSKTPAVV